MRKHECLRRNPNPRPEPCWDANPILRLQPPPLLLFTPSTELRISRNTPITGRNVKLTPTWVRLLLSGNSKVTFPTQTNTVSSSTLYTLSPKILSSVVQSSSFFYHTSQRSRCLLQFLFHLPLPRYRHGYPLSFLSSRLFNDFPPKESWWTLGKIVFFDPWRHLIHLIFANQLRTKEERSEGSDIRPSIAVTRGHKVEVIVVR
ncbi:hypothetical protein D9758_014409 [Tetrapyrgos nigripes]|uniref:GTP cyclohydrolase N-terminal domain-containing protein n=1 Tax=Tetrapyrgos nigripes TaxID=182062 RepID=A0A8H5FPI0_9AGAR|nr:hypothetical protein D9758_014409 [Tetrapyrgos nigripes]